VSDPVEVAMEEVLRPGRYISDHASFSVVNELESVAARIAGADAERAVGLYETFIAACYEKADEVDDSSGYFGTFGGSLFSRWVSARQAVSADPADTVARLLTWMANDQYGFWSHVEDDIASALDEAGRAACAGRIERLLGTGTEPAFTRRQLDKLLRAVYIAQRDADAYIALAERSGLSARDCLAMATILAAKDDPAAALTWTERGLGIESSYDLRAKHRELLTALGRRDEAVQNEWSHFTQVPTIYSYQTLMELVPEAERATWHHKAIEAAGQSDASLSVLLPLLVETKEVARLARAIDRCADDHLSHAGYRAVEAAEALDESHPEQAARLWRALGLGIVRAGKSKQYGAAVEYFGRAKRCFTAAGLPDCWDQLVDQVRTNHYRKAGFIREFEKVAAGMTPEREPTFLEKARARWAPPD
jgi:Family of unknown function (DUF6880)